MEKVQDRMGFNLSRAALDRPKQTIHASELFHQNAVVIATACADAMRDEVVAAVVDRTDMVFHGVWTIPVQDIGRRVPQLEGNGWCLIFSPGTSVEEVERRALQMARLAYARWEAMQVWASRHR